MAGRSSPIAIVLAAFLDGCNSLVGINPPIDPTPGQDASKPIDSSAPSDNGSLPDLISSAESAIADRTAGNDGASTDASFETGSSVDVGSSEAGARVDKWAPIPTTTDSPGDRMNHSAVWTGKEMIVWGGRYVMTPNMQTGGRYDPVTEKWTPTSLVNAPPARAYHTAVWTGELMIIWGGTPAEGGKYDPLNDHWLPMADSHYGAGRSGHAAVWTGSQMLVWCGVAPGTTPVGERYTLDRDEWTNMSTTGAPPCATSGVYVWTGSKLIVWGGYMGGTVTSTGGVYDPANDTWRLVTTTGAPAARMSHSAVWTGSRMIIWGGEKPEGNTVRVFDDGAAYDPDLDRWQPIATAGTLGTTRHVAAWAPPAVGRPGLMLVWGGSIESPDAGIHLLGEGHVYDPLLDSWYSMSMAGEPWPRTDPTVVWTEREMIVWGGFRSLAVNGSTGRDGGRYTP